MIDGVRVSRWLSLVAAVVGFVACRNLVDPDLPANAEAFTPPSVYARWWAMTEACSGLSGDLSSVSWYVVPGVGTVNLDGKQVTGYWSYASNRIVLAGTAKPIGADVRHEMLHALIKARGHPRGKFLQGCGGVVTCNQVCIDDAGAALLPDPASLRIGPEPLEVHVDVQPAAPSRALDDGFFSLIVSVRNASTSPVVVELPTRPLGGGLVTFSFDLVGQLSALSGNEFFLDTSEKIFAAGETKRHVFDFVIGTQLLSRSLQPGTYTVQAGYGGNIVGRAPLVLLP
jgi:hypothetical protein